MNDNLGLSCRTKASPIMQFFAYSHLPDHLHPISQQFCEIAAWVDANLPSNAEKSTALRKLLEAKDCAVRAHLYKDKD